MSSYLDSADAASASYTDSLDTAKGFTNTSSVAEPADDAVPSYLVGADNHQLGNTSSSILDPSTWGDRVDNAFKFSVSALTRAVASTYNSVITVGKLAGVADDSDKADTKQWLQGMDDNLAQYYEKNQTPINAVGDFVGMFAPGLAGVKVLNWAQKGVELATEGRAGLSLAAHFGTLPTKQAMFAEKAAADMASTTNTFSLINANLAKSLAAGYGQSALEVAAFNTAAAATMQDSPLFQGEDASDIAYNAMLGGGFIGAGIMGTAIAAKTITAVKRAGDAVDEATHAWRTVLTEPEQATPASEKLAIHLNNIEAIPTVAKDDPLFAQKMKAASATRLAELDNGRMASHALAGNDAELGNTFFDVVSQGDSEDVAQKMVGLVRTSRAGYTTQQEQQLVKEGTGAVSYLQLTGANAGTITSDAPTTFLADKLKSEAEVMATVNAFGHRAGQDWEIATANGNADNIEARYIAAQEAAPIDYTKVKIGARDIPFLERAYQDMSADNSIDTITLRDGTELDRPLLLNHITSLKGDEANKLLELNNMTVGENNLTVNDIAKMVNVSPTYLQGEMNLAAPSSDWFAMQTTTKNFTQQQIEAGMWRADKGLIKTYLKPSQAKLVYDTSKIDDFNDMFEVKGMAAIKEQQANYTDTLANVVNNYFGEATADLPQDIPGSLLVGANRSGVGGGLFSNLNGNYKTLASYVQQIGAVTASLIQKRKNVIADTFSPAGYQLLNNEDAKTELWKVVQQLRQTPEQYSLVTDSATGKLMLKNIKQVQYEKDLADAQAAVQQAQQGVDIKAITAARNKLANMQPPEFEDKTAPVTIPIETPAMQAWANTWQEYNATHLNHVANLRAAQGLQVKDLRDVFYIPPVDVRKYPHFAFVRDTTLTNTGKLSTIHAASEAELEQLAARVPTDQGLEVIFKDQSERWHQAMQDYDYDLGINENYVDSALRRSGVSASFFPKTDANGIWDDLMSWRQNQDIGLLREMVESRYSTAFTELRRQGAQYDLAANSRVGYQPALLKKQATNPFNDYINTALYRERSGTTPIWTAINRLAETSVSSAISKLQDTWKQVATPEDLDKVNKVLQQIGCNTYQDAATMALANHSAPKPILSNFVRKANSLLTFTMLKSDPLNAINNGLGHSVLYGTEMRNLIQDILTNPDAKAEFQGLGQIKIPGADNWVTSPAKLAANAYAAWWKHIIAKEDGGQLVKRYTDLNLLPNYTDQFRSMSDALTLNGAESESVLRDKMNIAFAAAKKIDELGSTYSGNNKIEQMNRFVSAYTADQVCQVAVKHGLLDERLVPSVINTFVNRVEGNALAAQRPLLFRGPVGQAIGLFQTYQFNMLQQLFRHVGNGDTKSMATLLGLQGSIYGLNGLPAFNAMNNYLVGNAAGNTQHSDVVSTTYQAAGQELGDWLMYGISSNMLLHPDAKVNLYSRGDINPRQVTVIPTNVADVPAVGAATKFFSSMYNTLSKVEKGGDAWGAFLQGVEHSGVSRPLAGIAQALEATNNPAGAVYSTTSKGNIVMENDFFSAMTAARILGAKPLDEARAIDAMHRVQVYSEARQAQLDTLGASIKATIAGGKVPTQDQLNNFTAEYMKLGGDQQHFSAWFTKQVLNADKSSVNQLVENMSNPLAQYMQKVMGGYQLKDFVNSQSDTGGTE